MKMKELRERIRETGILFKTIAENVGLSRQYYNELLHLEANEKRNLILTLTGLKIVQKKLARLISDIEKTKDN